MPKKYSFKFLLIFWVISAIFLAVWFLFWNTKNNGISSTVADMMRFAPISSQQKKQYQALATIGDFFLKKDGQEKTLLVLFQNNLEIRPGGGFIGAFGIVKIKDGKVISTETQDLSNFDAGIPNNIDPPYPMREIGYVDYWKMRDSNFSPDFETDAQKATEFYHLGGGQEKIDGVVGVTSNVLTSLLKITGPVQIEGYPGSYDSSNAIIALEYQVEEAFENQGIDRTYRKSIMSDLAEEIEKRIVTLGVTQKIELAKVLLDDLSKKDIQLQFNDQNLQTSAQSASWAGNVDQSWNKDFLMVSDANLGAFKSDYYVKRSIDYSADLSQIIPTAKLKITYQHTATQKDWMTRDYLTYLRVYVPQGSQIVNSQNFDNVRIGNEFGKTYFGALVKVPIGTTKTVEIDYTLPESIKENYDLMIQKQAGVSGVPLSVHITNSTNSNQTFSALLDRDLVMSELY